MSRLSKVRNERILIAYICSYAKQQGFEILPGPEHCNYLRFADGSAQETIGQVSTFWTFCSGKRIPIVFEVLENCCSDLIIGDDILWENDVFEAHADSITCISNMVDHYSLAPFSYEKDWKKIFGKCKPKNTSGLTQNYPSYDALLKLYRPI